MKKRMLSQVLIGLEALTGVAFGSVLVTTAAAQTAKAPAQVVKPPVAQAWIDVSTFTGMGMPGMGGVGAGVGAGMGIGSGANPMAMLGSLFGGGQSAKNVFGMTQTGSAGRWVDVTLSTSRNPALSEALHAVPSGMSLAPSLKLVAPKAAKGPPPTLGDDGVIEPEFERPKGKMFLYWGCGDTIRAGQPRVLDMAAANAGDFQKFFVSRRATQRGAHSAIGRPVWPNEVDARMLPGSASLAGEHAFTGQGVPENFKFAVPPAQDLMPAIQLNQTEARGATQLEWAGLPTARAYFVAAMGAKGGSSGTGGSEAEMVFWTSSELPEVGMGLLDYQTNSAVDRWLKEKVLLEPAVTRCTVPKGIFAAEGGAMLRLIAYGSELNLAYPPRPTDSRLAWEPEFAVKLRVKSVANAVLGLDMGMNTSIESQQRSAAGTDPATTPTDKKDEMKKLDPVGILRGILGR